MACIPEPIIGWRDVPQINDGNSTVGDERIVLRIEISRKACKRSELAARTYQTKVASAENPGQRHGTVAEWCNVGEAAGQASIGQCKAGLSGPNLRHPVFRFGARNRAILRSDIVVAEEPDLVAVTANFDLPVQVHALAAVGLKEVGREQFGPMVEWPAEDAEIRNSEAARRILDKNSRRNTTVTAQVPHNQIVARRERCYWLKACFSTPSYHAVADRAQQNFAVSAD